jgi:hypothetical protein
MLMTVYVVVQRARCEGARYVQPIIYYKYDDEMLVPENDFDDDNGRDAVGGVDTFVVGREFTNSTLTQGPAIKSSYVASRHEKKRTHTRYYYLRRVFQGNVLPTHYVMYI